MNYVIMDYLINEGYPAAAKKFAAEANMQHFPGDTESIEERVSIRNSILQGNIQAAIEKINDLDSEVCAIPFHPFTGSHEEPDDDYKPFSCTTQNLDVETQNSMCFSYDPTHFLPSPPTRASHSPQMRMLTTLKSTAPRQKHPPPLLAPPPPARRTHPPHNHDRLFP